MSRSSQDTSPSSIGRRLTRHRSQPLHAERLEDRLMMSADDALASAVVAEPAIAISSAVSQQVAGLHQGSPHQGYYIPGDFESPNERRQWIEQEADRQFGHVFGTGFVTTIGRADADEDLHTRRVIGYHGGGATLPTPTVSYRLADGELPPIEQPGFVESPPLVDDSGMPLLLLPGYSVIPRGLPGGSGLIPEGPASQTLIGTYETRAEYLERIEPDLFRRVFLHRRVDAPVLLEDFQPAGHLANRNSNQARVDSPANTNIDADDLALLLAIDNVQSEQAESEVDIVLAGQSQVRRESTLPLIPLEDSLMALAINLVS